MDKVKNRISLSHYFYDGEELWSVDQIGLDGKLKLWGEFKNKKEAKAMALKLGRDMRVEVWSSSGVIYTTNGTPVYPSNY